MGNISSLCPFFYRKGLKARAPRVYTVPSMVINTLLAINKEKKKYNLRSFISLFCLLEGNELIKHFLWLIVASGDTMTAIQANSQVFQPSPERIHFHHVAQEGQGCRPCLLQLITRVPFLEQLPSFLLQPHEMH